MDLVRKARHGTGDCDPTYEELAKRLIAIDDIIKGWEGDVYASDSITRECVGIIRQILEGEEK